MVPEQPYNPLDKLHLAESVVKALLERPCVALPPPEAFHGAGIYALYYHGAFPLYLPIAEQNRGGCVVPLYVGKAVPKGSRRGGFGLDAGAGPVLYSRLREHAECIRQATNLDLDHFRCRYLVVDDIWIPLGEQLLIERYRPLWNGALDGFGNHDPGEGRYNQQRSLWDVLHPGRPWAERLQPNRRSREAIEQGVSDYLRRTLSSS